MKKIFGITFLLSIFAFSASAPQSVIRIEGADTLILLGQHWAQMYSQKQPHCVISVGGGTVLMAMKSLAAGRATIVQSEGVKPESGFTFPVAVEGIAIYINKDNPVGALTLDQLRKIFLGDITNWKQVGGLDKNILLYAGESTTGVLPYFQQAVLRNAEPYPFVGEPSAKELVDTIAGQPTAIGYASIFPSDKVKVVRIKASESSPAIEASIENIRSRKYPITRYAYWHLAGKPRGAVKELCEWVLSKDGQLIVEGVGFEPLTPSDRASGMAKLH
jgi:phosphate transport system substrate-binding protein